ncbi:MAG: hypothetical protein RLY21_395 [Planctomycetota bacterium]
MKLRLALPIAVLCSLLGACTSGGGKAATAPEPAPATESPKTVAKPKPSTPETKVVKKQAPAPAAQPEAKFEISTPQEPYYDQQAPSKPATPQPAKPEVAKPVVVKPEPPAALAAPPLVTQPEAIAALERAREKLAGVRTIDFVSLTEATGEVAANIPGLGVRNRVQLRFQYDDAVSVPFFVITRIVETPSGEAIGARVIYDGQRAVILDDASRTFVDPGRAWFEVVGPNLSAIPQWYFKERMTLARRKPGANVTGAGALEPELIGARILGVEQFDGQECDVVEFFYSKDIVKFSETDGQPEVVDEQRYTETIHFARADAMPRKIVMRDIPHPSAPPGSGSTVTVQMVKVAINPGYEASFFDTSIPTGYQPQAKR